MRFWRTCVPLVAALVATPFALPQPSGGPYGPQRLTYSIPENAAHVFYVAPNGEFAATGANPDQSTTLETAIARATTGDAIILRGGVYRTGGLRFNQGITLQPYGTEEPVLKGTRVATKWESQPNGLWRTAWDKLFPAKPADWWRRDREGRKTPLHRFNNDMVFLDGQPLKSVGWEGQIDAQSYAIDYEHGHVYIGIDPTNRLVEITAFDNAFTRTTQPVNGRNSDRKGPTIRGLTLTQYAYRALEIHGKDPEGVSPESEHGKDVVGTTLEHVTITHCSRVAAYLRGDRLTLRHCRVSDTSTEGIFILSSSDVLLEKNIFARNNVEEITGYYPAAVKIFNQCHRVTCRDNLVIDQPNSNGIWYDVGNHDGVFVNNWIEGALDGFFFEISWNAICAGNVFVNCDKGVRVLNSAGVQVYHNTFVNTVASFERNERSAVGDHFGWHPRTGPDVDQREGHAFFGNLLLADATFPKPLLRFEQPAALKTRLTRPQATRIDDNLYVRSSAAATARALIAWSPNAGTENMLDLESPARLHELFSMFESHSRAWNADYRTVIRSAELKRFEPVVDLRGGGEAGTTLPKEVAQAAGWTDAPHAPGAYQPAPR